VTRSGVQLKSLIEKEGSLINKYKHNVLLVENPVPNEVSSSLVREEVRKGHSVKYLVPDEVIEYIKLKRLYK